MCKKEVLLSHKQDVDSVATLLFEHSPSQASEIEHFETFSRL